MILFKALSLEEGCLFLLPQLSPKDTGRGHVTLLTPFSPYLTLKPMALTPPHLTLLSYQGSVLLPGLALPLLGRREAAFQGSCPLEGWHPQWSWSFLNLHKTGTSPPGSRKSQDLETLNLKDWRWNHQLCCKFCTWPWTWATSEGLWKSHLQSH